MPAYVPITEVETDPEAPLTSELAKKWRDNPIAMFEAQTGAPRLNRNALLGFGAGSTAFSFVSGGLTTSSATYVDAYTFNFVQPGTVRVVFVQAVNNSANTSDAQVVRTRANVTTVLQTYSTGSTGGVVRSLDVSVIHGDIVTVRHRSTTGQSILSSVQYQNDGTPVWDTTGGRSLL